MTDPQPVADPDLPTSPAGTALRPAAERGSLVVRDRVVQRLVEAVVSAVPGTADHREETGLGRLGLGGSYPRAAVELQGGRARVTVDAACVWPCRLDELAVRVRDEVLTEVTRLSGVEVRDVDVALHPVPAGTTSGRRVA